MTKQLHLCSVDLGAESGRVSLGSFDGSRLDIAVVHRFTNRAVRLNGVRHWDTPAIFREILEGLRLAVKTACGPIASVGIDSWGVDFGILDVHGQLMGIPVHYRDKRTEGLIDEVTSIIPREEIFRQSGIAFWPFNTLYQLRALVLQNSYMMREGDTLLFTPDLLHYWLSGAKVSERSIASTSQCLSVEDDIWLTGMLETLGIPSRIMPEVVPSGTLLGPILEDVAGQIGQRNIQVITPASHDTASAVVSTPFTSDTAAFLSCGTWSLLGIETDSPLATPAALEADFTNEKGADRTYRFLKNIMGLWLVQQSRACWLRNGEEYDYAMLAELAQTAPPFQSWIDPNDLRFYAPQDMLATVRQYCMESGQYAPQGVAETMRCLLESLAFTYRAAIDQIEEIKDMKISCLHIIGGGSQNKTLCQWTSNALGRSVIAGPAEGTTMGNLLIQLQSLKAVTDLAEGREVVRRSCELLTYEPEDLSSWEDAYHYYLKSIHCTPTAS